MFSFFPNNKEYSRCFLLHTFGISISHEREGFSADVHSCEWGRMVRKTVELRSETLVHIWSWWCTSRYYLFPLEVYFACLTLKSNTHPVHLTGLWWESEEIAALWLNVQNVCLQVFTHNVYTSHIISVLKGCRKPTHEIRWWIKTRTTGTEVGTGQEWGTLFITSSPPGDIDGTILLLCCADLVSLFFTQGVQTLSGAVLRQESWHQNLICGQRRKPEGSRSPAGFWENTPWS